MDTFLGRFRNPLVLLAVVLAQTLWLATQVQRPLRGGVAAAAEDGPKVTLLRAWAMGVAGPVERVVEGTGGAVQRVWGNYVDLRGARQRNAALEGEVARLRLEQAAFAQDAAEGRRLQALLGFKQQYVTSTVAAEVIGTSGSDRSHVLWIDKGWADGLRPEQAVITPDGVVGKLRDVQAHTAQLLLISDPNSGAGVILASSRMRGIIHGTAAGEVEITNLTADERIKPGEQVITSGGDQVFPRGLPVGTVLSVEPDVKHQPYTLIHLRPAANLRRLEEVLVITGTSAAMPPAAERDAAEATAAAVAEQDQRAADLVAARLPGLRDEGASGATGASGVSGATGATGDLPAVRVKAPVHADRYSPGTAPPAAELTPGGPQ